MRILFVTRSLPFHHLGGMEAVAWDLARSLASRGHYVEILTTKWGDLGETVLVEGVYIRTMNVPAGRYSNGYWRMTRDLFKSRYMNEVDIVLSIGMGAYSIARVRNRGAHPPILMQSHGQAWGELISKFVVPNPLSWLKSPKNLLDLVRDRTLRRFDRIIPVGQAVTQVLSTYPTRWLLGRTPVTQISNGVSEQHFAFDEERRRVTRSRLSISVGATVLISACRLHVQKGIRESLSGFAIALQRQPELVYLIVGAGPAEASLRAYVQHLNIGKSVRFLGAVRREDLPGVLSAADIFLFTSKRREGLALGPLEASAVGLSCILSNHLAVPELDAILVNPNSSSEIADAICIASGTVNRYRLSKLPECYSLSYASSKYEECFKNEINDRILVVQAAQNDVIDPVMT